MRISTNQIYAAGALNMQRSQGDLYKLQNQISTGRRILTPADDPVAAAQALVFTQSQSVTEQHLANQGTASDQLALVDTQLSSLTDLLQNVRARVVQANNATLTSSDRQTIATELESSLSEMMGIANSDNGSGDFLFSGYQGGTRPFAVDASLAVLPPATTAPVGYFGDDGQRLLQVSASRQMAINVAGSDVFMNAKSGNGNFVAAPSISNQGSATVDTGSVQDQQKWLAGINGPWSSPTNPALQIKFTVLAGVTTYQIYDVSTPATPALVSPTPALPYTLGQAIPLVTTTQVPPATLPATDFGAQVVVNGQPADGDTFNIKPSSNQSLFQTMQSLIGILKKPVGTYTSTQLAQDLGAQLTNVAQALDNVSRVRTTVGTRMNELDSLSSASSDLAIQYATTLSDLQDLDYAKALTDFAKQQVNLEAAQKSFVQISGLSLFNYL